MADQGVVQYHLSRDELERAVRVLAEKIDCSVDSNDALKYTQAALNMAHVYTVMFNAD